ncbi:MAG: uncharacterized protein PWP65_1346 [Clostridia bacterium]|nr:uncharacterized protein [Clostridia bacterium]
MPNIFWAAGKLGRVIVGRFRPGDDLLNALENLAREAGLTSGIILSGVASLRKAVLRNPKGFLTEFPITEEYRYAAEIEGPLELTNLTGNIATGADGRVIVHAHATVSAGEKGGAAWGGHLLPGCIIYTTAEVVLAGLEGMKLCRREDDLTKGEELFPEKA